MRKHGQKPQLCCSIPSPRSHSAEQIEVHLFLLFLFLDNLGSSSCRGGTAGSGTSAAASATAAAATAAAAAAQLEELLHVLAVAHLRKERGEEGVDLSTRRFDQLVQAVLGDVEVRVLQDHGGICTEELVLLCLRHLVSWHFRHG